MTRLEATRTRDIAAGITLIGPHRDDLTMTLGPTQLSSPDTEDTTADAHARSARDETIADDLTLDDEDDESPDDAPPTSNLQPPADQNQRPAGAFASRGQQRTAALALRLAEATYLESATNERPILLLDDVLSELDESRRHSVLTAIEAEQTIITSADPDRFASSLLAKAQVWRITNGRAERE